MDAEEIQTRTSELELFVLDNRELESLEDGLSEVNFFEAVGADHAENRHSDFLAFLLEPTESHGLNELFLKRFLQRAVAGRHSPIGPVDLDLADLSDTIVRREYENIDIFLINERAGVAIVIENKVDSEEHDNQLSRYREFVARRYPTLKNLCLYLTVDGTPPTHVDYIPISYATICELVEEISNTRSTSIDNDIAILLRHYARLLRRHFMEEDELKALARRVYAKHRRALDFIFEQRPDQQADIAEILRDLLTNSPGLLLDHSTKSVTAFVPAEWDAIPELKTGTRNFSPDERLLLFWFDNAPSYLRLKLTIWQGNEEIRAKLFDACKSGRILKQFSTKLYATATIWVKPFLRKDEMDGLDTDHLREHIAKAWEDFKAIDLPKIRSRIEEIMHSIK